tara:strand:+ start:561 stop:665 length:105 start_codon:yes stop_codon:yes gene_type:complete
VNAVEQKLIEKAPEILSEALAAFAKALYAAKKNC